MKQHTNKAKLAALAVGTSILAACGGGGDDPAPVASTASFPLAQVADSLIKSNASFFVKIEGTASPSGQSVTFSGTGTVSTSNVASSFEGIAGRKSTTSLTGSMQGNGISIPLADTSAEYFGVDNKPLGTSGSDFYCVYANQAPIPATAKISDTGTWFTGTCYDSSNKYWQIGKTQASYILEPDTGTTAILKLVRIMSNNSGQATNMVTSAYRISTTGTFTRVTETGSITSGGVTVNMIVTYQ